jgi:hypothetical protein
MNVLIIIYRLTMKYIYIYIYKQTNVHCMLAQRSLITHGLFVLIIKKINKFIILVQVFNIVEISTHH